MVKRKSLTEKACSKCGTVKPCDEFYHRSDKPHLYMSHCKQCIIDKTDENNKKNISKKHERDRRYHYLNRNKKILVSRIYAQNNKEKRNEINRLKYKNDLNFRISTNLRNRVRGALKRNSKSQTTVELIGCSLDFLKNYLQSKFVSGMSWDNYGKWQIDHIIPCAYYDLSSRENQLKCFNYKNLQPLWAIDNLIKKDKIEKGLVCYR